MRPPGVEPATWTAHLHAEDEAMRRFAAKERPMFQKNEAQEDAALAQYERFVADGNRIMAAQWDAANRRAIANARARRAEAERQRQEAERARLLAAAGGK